MVVQVSRSARSQPKHNPAPVNPMLSAPVGQSVLGPHGGQVVTDGSNKFEVNVDNTSGKIDVYEIETRTQPPNYMEIKLFQQNGEPETVALGASPLQDVSNPYPHYQGTLTMSQTPNMGFELRFQEAPANSAHG